MDKQMEWTDEKVGAIEKAAKEVGATTEIHTEAGTFCPFGYQVVRIFMALSFLFL